MQLSGLPPLSEKSQQRCSCAMATPSRSSGMSPQTVLTAPKRLPPFPVLGLSLEEIVSNPLPDGAAGLGFPGPVGHPQYGLTLPRGIMFFLSSCRQGARGSRNRLQERGICISSGPLFCQGRTDRLMNDPCLLPHVDFDEGTRSWNVSPAEPDSVAGKSL